MAADQLLGLHRQQIAVEHAGRLDIGFRQRQGGKLDGKPARLQHAAPHVLGAFAKMHVAGVDLAPRVDDADDRLAAIVGLVEPHLLGPGAMAEGAQVGGAEPAAAAELFGRLPGHDRLSMWSLGNRLFHFRLPSGKSAGDHQEWQDNST
jgi:hypothetical protein